MDRGFVLVSRRSNLAAAGTLAGNLAAAAGKLAAGPFSLVVATDTRAVGELAGITVGATVMLNILVAGGASMNSVRTLGPAIAAGNYTVIWIYLLAPTLGALAGSGVYTLVKLQGVEGEEPRTVRSFRR